MKQKIIIGMIAVMILMIFITGCTDEKNAVSSPEDEMELPPPPPAPPGFIQEEPIQQQGSGPPSPPESPLLPDAE
jgi:PBP1b-binding outer membrane lipoprotein LpoB